MTLRVLGVIPARGGSKGVPRKNIKSLAGRPLIDWTIQAALASGKLSRTIVSTDDDEIAAVARGLGADVPFVRPSDLATDSAGAVPTMQHALQAMEALEGRNYDALMMLQPTTPLRTTANIDGAIDLLAQTGADGVISVVDVDAHHPARMKYLEGDRLIDPPFCEAFENQPRQQLQPMFLRNGAIYLTRRAVLLGGGFKGRDCRALVMTADRSVNIDTERDFRLLEFIIREGLA